MNYEGKYYKHEFDPHECVILLQSTKIGTHGNNSKYVFNLVNFNNITKWHSKAKIATFTIKVTLKATTLVLVSFEGVSVVEYACIWSINFLCMLWFKFVAFGL